ncbi:MAG TPA: CAP domain-containing protein [Terriglobia bacterium]|nr:CAP domain-containing protein [Terriglobia bacterium]
MTLNNFYCSHPGKHETAKPSRRGACLMVLLAALFLPVLAPVLAAPGAGPARAARRPESGADSMESLAKQMLALVNRDREDPANAAETHGRALPLRWNDKLAAVALAHSRDMMVRRYFAHVDPEGRTPTDRINAAGIEWRGLAENISMDRTVPDAEKDLMDEPRFQQNHRGNILNPAYTDIGIGIVRAPDGDLYITQDFIAAPPRREGGR